MENYQEYKEKLTEAVQEAVSGKVINESKGKPFSVSDINGGRFLNVDYPIFTDGAVGFSISDSLSKNISRRMLVDLDCEQVEKLVKYLSSILPKAKKASMDESDEVEGEVIGEKLTDAQREIKREYKKQDAKYDNSKYDADNHEAKKEYVHKMRVIKKNLHGQERKDAKQDAKNDLNDRQHFNNSMKGKNNLMKRYNTKENTGNLDHQQYEKKEREKFNQAMKDKKSYKL